MTSPVRIRILSYLLWITLGMLGTLNNAIAADNDGIGDKPGLTLKVGQIFFSSMDTSFLADTNSGPLSTTIDFDRDLDMEDSVGSFLIEGIYRIDATQRIDFSYYEIDRDGQRRLNRDVEFGDETFLVNSVVNSQFDFRTLILTYSYLFHSLEEIDLGISGGLHINEAELALETEIGNISESIKQTTPLPVIGILLRYDLSDDWTLNYQNRVFLLNYDDFRGSLNDAKLTFEYDINQDLGLEIGINRRDSELEVKEPDNLVRSDNVAFGWLVNLVWHIN